MPENWRGIAVDGAYKQHKTIQIIYGQSFLCMIQFQLAIRRALPHVNCAWRGGNRGSYVELAAPGVDVSSAAPGGGVTGWTGTSFAVPFAVAALMRARAETGGDPAAARALLGRTAEDLGAPGRDDATGFGLLRAPSGRCQ